MPIDRSFKTTWNPAGNHKGHTMWQSPQTQLGIHGTRVAVDFDLCTGCLKCLRVCPVDVFVQYKPNERQIKADPVNESDCLECLACELVCPVDAIFVHRNSSGTDTLSALLDE